MTAAAIKKSDLEKHEETIANGLRTFVEVGRALAAIRDGKLYERGGYATFETYCKSKWEISRPRAYELIGAARTVSAIADKNLPPPSNEAQCRPLTKLPPNDQPMAWAEALKTAADGVVTAKHVAAVVKKRLPHEEPPPKSCSEVTQEDVRRAREALDEINRKQAERVAREESSPTTTEPSRFCSGCGLSVNIGCVCDRSEPANDHQSDLDAIESRSEEEIEAAMKAAMDGEDEPDPEPVLEHETVFVADLEGLSMQRNADPDFAQWLDLQNGIASKNRGLRMALFILAGGELALLRLGLDWSVTAETAKKAYRAATLKAHPDRGGSQESIVALNRDYELVKAMLGEGHG